MKYRLLEHVVSERDGKPYERYTFDNGLHYGMDPRAKPTPAAISFVRTGDDFRILISGLGEQHVTEKEWRDGIAYQRRQYMGPIGRIIRLFSHILRGTPL